MSKFFGNNPDGWNLEPINGDEFFNEYHAGDGTNRPGIDMFNRALKVWVGMQNRNPSVRRAAKAFCCEDLMIIEAVNWDEWSYITGPDDDPKKQIIELEGY